MPHRQTQLSAKAQQATGSPEKKKINARIPCGIFFCTSTD
jgi:hypothetical protein